MATKRGGKTLFCKKSPVDSADTLRVQNFVEIAVSRSVSEINASLPFYAEIQDGRQKWRENDFWEKSPVHSADTLWVKNFVEIALSRSVSQISVFLYFTPKFKMAAKSGKKRFLGKVASRLSKYPISVRFRDK